jgi:DNA replication and repair protein RecF
VYTPNSEPPIQIGYLENLKSKFETNYTKELVVGKTLYGIHKDDYKFILNDISDLRYLGSRGQQRIGILLLKLAQIKLYGLKAEIKPIFLIDDVMSELDSENRKSVAELVLQSGSQIFLTSADLNEIPPLLNERSSLIRLSE